MKLNLEQRTTGCQEMSEKDFRRVIADWQLPKGNPLLRRVEKMIRPALLGGYFGSSYTRFVSGLQYTLVANWTLLD